MNKPSEVAKILEYLHRTDLINNLKTVHSLQGDSIIRHIVWLAIYHKWDVDSAVKEFFKGLEDNLTYLEDFEKPDSNTSPIPFNPTQFLKHWYDEVGNNMHTFHTNPETPADWNELYFGFYLAKGKGQEENLKEVSDRLEGPS